MCVGWLSSHRRRMLQAAAGAGVLKLALDRLAAAQAAADAGRPSGRNASPGAQAKAAPGGHARTPVDVSFEAMPALEQLSALPPE
eukprot:360487-Chlamydomonas_euryale.AAC.4